TGVTYNNISEADGRYVAGDSNLWIPYNGIEALEYRLGDTWKHDDGSIYRVPMFMDNKLIIRYKFMNPNKWSEQKKNWVRGALNVLKSQTCLFFWRIGAQAKIRRNFKYIAYNVNDRQCSSTVGRKSGHTNSNIGGCTTPALVLHESMHAIGFTHEHQRPNRDQFVKIYWNNIASAKQYAYYKKNTGYANQGFITPDDYYTIWGYDYYSIMHYPGYQLLNGEWRRVFKVLRKGININEIGLSSKVQGLSWKDEARLEYYYGCNNYADLREELKDSFYLWYYSFDKTFGYRSNPSSSRPIWE
ncbi:hypothetical protein B4U80_05571, partial [Leptotrombidium deliense]